MPSGVLSFVGRDREVELLTGALDAARDGRGGLWLLSGEPGIGKSRLAEEMSARATRGGFRVLWGQCWEAGGAPAFWPWIQVLRAFRRAAPDAEPSPTRTPYLVQLLPELREGRPEIPEPPPLGAEQARFQLLDAVAGWLSDAAIRSPLLVIFEDLHAADSSSLLLLDFLSRQARGAPLMILGTYREADAQRTASAQLLLRIASDVRTIALGRLGRSDVLRLLAGALGEEPPGALVESVFTTTEGNALFLVELARLLVAHGLAPESGQSPPIPSTVRTAIRERIEGLSPATQQMLAQAAVAGRELLGEILVTALGRDRARLPAEIEEAVRAAILLPVGTKCYRFSHVLIREVLYHDLPPAQRAELHRALAETLASGVPDHPWSEIAHHFLAAGEPGRLRAVDALVKAGEQAVEQLAFDEAISSYSTAASTYAQTPEPDPARQVELLIGLGHAQLRSGDLTAGRRSCSRAADLARDLGEASLFARAALEYGSVLVFAHVDPRLVSLLEEARAALGDAESSLLARVLARLAAAQQPAPDLRQPIALAQEAIAMARRVGDKPTLLAALRTGCSAMMDLADPGDRIELNREHVRLARELGDPVEAYRGWTRLAFDSFELGQLTEALTAIDAVTRIAAELGHPYYQWRAVAFRATRALWEGRFAEAEAAIDEAQALGERGGDPNAPHAGVYQRARLLRLQGRTRELVAAARDFGPLFDGTPQGESIAQMTMASYLLQTEGREEARTALASGRKQAALALSDRTLLEALAELAAAFDDPELARRLGERLLPWSERLVSGGVLGMTWDGPLSRSLALAAMTLGRVDDARRYFEDAITRAARMRGRPMVAWIEADYAEMLARIGVAADRERARELAEDAARIADELGMATVAARVQGCLEASSPARPPAPEPPPEQVPADGVAAAPGVRSFRLSAEGAVWRIDCDGETFRLKDSKGLRFLSRLLEVPGSELHVLDLVGEGRPGADGGDAGEMLDPTARAQYQRRVDDLRDELGEAEAMNDTGRAERARAELEMIGAELARAVGLGGRARRAGSASERARVNVTRRLRDAIRQIEAQHPALGRYLSWTIRTGTYCCYRPR